MTYCLQNASFREYRICTLNEKISPRNGDSGRVLFSGLKFLKSILRFKKLFLLDLIEEYFVISKESTAVYRVMIPPATIEFQPVVANRSEAMRSVFAVF
jgi:hypothetical protein